MYGGPPAQRWRLLAFSTILAAVLLLWIATQGRHRQQQQQQQQQEVPEQQPAGWAASFIFQKADPKLSKLLDKASLASPLFENCKAERVTLDLTSVSAEAALLGPVDREQSAGSEEVVRAVAHNLPCRKAERVKRKSDVPSGCCFFGLTFRPHTTDFSVFQQVFQWHYMRYLYVLFGSGQAPRYILDAGSNVGFATVLFKLLWPDATVVSLEPDPNNFAQLQRNTQGLPDVHPINAGLWGRTADITLANGSHGYWGQIFREAKPGERGLPAYSVQDIAAKLNIPAFDFVKIDIEGAEGMVFAPDSDISWIQQAQAVSIEIHDYFGIYFGLQEVSTRIDTAFSATDYTPVADNEHVIYLNPQLRQALMERL